jgi:hypothetical protein
MVSEKTTRVDLRVGASKKDTWKRAAQEEGLSLSDWIACACDERCLGLRRQPSGPPDRKEEDMGTTVTLRVQPVSRTWLAGPEEWVFEDVETDEVFARVELKLSSILNKSRALVRDAAGALRAELPFNYSGWSPEERVRILRIVTRGFEPAVRVSNWDDLLGGGRRSG